MNDPPHDRGGLGPPRAAAQEASSGPAFALGPAPDEREGLLARIGALEADRAALAARVQERTLELTLARAEGARGQRFVDHVLSVVSHELRTPLTTILGLTEALQDGVYGPPQPRQRECLQVLDGAGRTLLGRIDDLLDLARAGAGRLALDAAVVDVGALVEGVRRAQEQSARARGVSLTMTVDPGSGVVHGDERRLRRALAHLLDNAIRFTPAAGAVVLEASADGPDARIVVSDTGGGMDPAAVAQAMRPFDGDRSLSRAGGAGLGLTVAARIIELHGGRLEVESSPVGTRVIVTLPRIVASSTAQSLARVLQLLGVRVVEHPGPERVVARAVEAEARAVVVAGDVPAADADQVVRALEESPTARRLPRLVVDATPAPAILAAFVDPLPAPRVVLLVGPDVAPPPTLPAASGEAARPHRR